MATKFDLYNSYHVEITFPFGELDHMMTWCKENCESEWRMGDSSRGYTFYFESKKDYFTFLLWNTNDNTNLS